MLMLSSWKCFHKLELDYEVESSNLEEKDRAIGRMLNTLHNVGYFTVRLIRIHLWAKNRFVSWVNINAFLGVHLRETLRVVTQQRFVDSQGIIRDRYGSFVGGVKLSVLQWRMLLLCWTGSLVSRVSRKEPAGDRSGHWVSHMCARNSPTATRICLEFV